MARRKRAMFQGNGQSTMSRRGQQARRTIRGVRDWIVGSRTCSSTGAPVTGQTTWSPSTGLTLNLQNFVAAEVVPTPMSSTPIIGELRVDEIKGSIFVSNGDTVASAVDLAVGIYVADLNNTTTLYTVRNVANPTEASRNDYLFLEGKRVFLPLAAGQTIMQEAIRFDLHLSQPVVISGGQAVIVSVYQVAGDKEVQLVLNISAYFRTLIGPVA
jgi:hypothetical protein